MNHCLPNLRPAAVLVAAMLAASAGAAWAADKTMVERGRYLVQIAGCNDCHTPGYGEKVGKVDEKDWLTGDVVGWHGPWGTTYPVNLRLYAQPLTEAEWMQRMKTLTGRPPMPWYNVRTMTERDQRAIYHYLKAAGPAGKPAPAYLPPDKTPPQPYIQFPG